MSASSPSADSTRFGRYQLIASLGHGGMADVFLALAQGPVGFSKLQVIKRLRTNLADEAEFLSMFLDEARLAARIDHPNVVQTNEVGEYDGQYFIAMEYLDGQPLNRALARAAKDARFTVPMALTVLADALAGLHFAHELCDFDGTPLGVVHRDVSPHNIFVTYAGHTKLVDFGIAKAATRSADTRAGVLKGKVGYMAPEQARCSDVDRRADIFSIGVCMWEVVAGVRPWRGQNDLEILERLVHEGVPSIHEHAPDASKDLRAIVERALALNPEDRYPTAAALRQEIVACLERSGQRVSAEEIGTALSAMFADRRAQFKSVLETQLSHAKSGGYLSLIDLQRTASLPRTPISQPNIDLTPSSARGGDTPSFAPSSETPSGSLKPIVADPPTSRSKLPLFLGGVAVLGALVGLLVLRRGQEPSAAAGAPTASPADSATAATKGVPASTLVQVQITAKPDIAAIYLDDAKLPQNPFSSKFPADGASHRLRVEAQGFSTENQVVVFEKDVSVDVSLKPAPTAEAETPTPGKHWIGVKPAPAATATTEAQPEPMDRPGGPGKPAKRTLDKNNPWE